MRMYVPVAAAALVLVLCGPAHADFVTTIQDTIYDIAYYGSSQYPYFGGSDQGDVIGTGFDTSKIVVTESNAANGALQLSFQIYTQFNGKDCFGSTCAYNADLFLRTPSTGYSAASFNYAIALGAQAPNGGIATPGLYTVSRALTSQDIWSSRGGFIYGGEYVSHDNSAGPEAAPTVLSAGQFLDGATVVQSQMNGDYIDKILLTLTGAEEVALRNGFDVFWGTGDCGNDAIFGSVPANPVPEPAAPTVFAAGLAGLLAAKEKWRATSLGPRTLTAPRWQFPQAEPIRAMLRLPAASIQRAAE